MFEVRKYLKNLYFNYLMGILLKFKQKKLIKQYIIYLMIFIIEIKKIKNLYNCIEQQKLLFKNPKLKELFVIIVRRKKHY